MYKIYYSTSYPPTFIEKLFQKPKLISTKKKQIKWVGEYISKGYLIEKMVASVFMYKSGNIFYKINAVGYTKFLSSCQIEFVNELDYEITKNRLEKKEK